MRVGVGLVMESGGLFVSSELTSHGREANHAGTNWERQLIAHPQLSKLASVIHLDFAISGDQRSNKLTMVARVGATAPDTLNFALATAQLLLPLNFLIHLVGSFEI